jgi:hypothetical protein
LCVSYLIVDEMHSVSNADFPLMLFICTLNLFNIFDTIELI